MKSSPLVPQTTDPSVVGKWNSASIPFKTVPVHISLLPNGKLLYWGRDKGADGLDVGGHSETYLVDPNNFFTDPNLNQTVTYHNTTTNLFCSGHSFLPDGRLFVTGGHFKNPGPGDRDELGETALNIFDYNNTSSPWTKLGITLSDGRWYPYNVTLENGNVAILGGTSWANRATPSESPLPALNESPEKYTYNPQGQGTIEKYQLIPTDSPFANQAINKYPLSHLGPDGRVLMLTGPNARQMDANTVDAQGPIAHMVSYPFPGMVNPAPGQLRYSGSSVLYDVSNGNGWVIAIGGSNSIGGAALAATNISNDVENGSQREWTSSGSMAAARTFHTATLLPDGKVLVSGGTRCANGNDVSCPGGAVLNPELWEPPSPLHPAGLWSVLPSNPSGTPRVYHSMAILLPDASVLIGGGGLPAAIGEPGSGTPGSIFWKGFGHKDAEIYYPPYLLDSNGNFKPRPTINWLQSDHIGLSQTMQVGVSDATNVSSVLLVRLGSVTHGFNQDQRRVVLSYSALTANRLNVSMPATGRLCPPGPYLMFVLDASGTPSIARTVFIAKDPLTLPQPPTALPNIGARAALDSTNRMHVFYRHLGDNQVRYIYQTSSGTDSWSTPTALGGTATTNPVAIADDLSRLWVFVGGTDSGIYVSRQNGSSWQGFYSLHGATTSEPALARNIDGRLLVFYRGTDNALWLIRQTTPGADQWDLPVNLGGVLTSEPHSGFNLNGQLEIFVQGTDNALYATRQTTPGGPTWSGFYRIGGLLTSAPEVGRNADGTLQVCYRNSNKTFPPGISCVGQKVNSTVWGLEESAGGLSLGAPALGTNANGILQAFIRWPDNTVRTAWQTAPGSGFTPTWQNLGANTSAPLNRPVVDDLGRMYIFVRGQSSDLQYNRQTAAGSSSAWRGFFPLGDSASSF